MRLALAAARAAACVRTTANALRHRESTTAHSDARRRARSQAAGIYLPDVPAAGDSRVRRWAHRCEAPVRVWVAPGDSVAGWRATFATVVREAFAAWEQVGLPVPFAFADRPDDAEVRVKWAERRSEQRATPLPCGAHGA